MKKTAILFIILFVVFADAALSQVTNYSFTAGTGIYTSITGLSPALTGDGANATRDEGYANNIPLGFTFNYLGTNYTTISASTNGFAAFGTITTPGFSNSIANGGTGRPLLAPLWEDITLAGAADLQYSTTGAAGSRVFILQWSNAFFDFGANNTSLSFQLRLYETSNLIEFIYNQLPGTVQNFSGGASIGITAAATGAGNFLSLNNSSGLPVISSSVATNTITTRPATGQVYTFTPPLCSAPGGISITGITSNSATVSWIDPAGGTNYEYAITNSAVPPASGIASAAVTLPVTDLLPGTQYYLHVRTNCGSIFSGWNTVGFTTDCDAANLPYIMPLSNVVCPALPLCVTVNDVNQDGNTWRTYSSGGQGWTDQVLAYVYNINGTTPANDWLFTRALNLTGGTYYRLKFKYNNDYTSLYTEKLKVAYGNTNTAAAMANTLADYPVVYSATPKTVSIDFTPISSGIYYIGFQAYSDANQDVLILDDISVDARPACDAPTALAANVASSGTSATVSWTAPAFGPPTGYEYAVITSAAPPASGTATTSVSVAVSSLIPYTSYYLHVRTNCGGTFSAWTKYSFATVGNDDPCKAVTLIAGAVPVCGNSSLATSLADPESECSSPNNTVWYKYTATANGTVVLHITTPAAPADPLHGWAGWYQRSGNCPNISLYQNGYCAEFGNTGNNDTKDLISPVLTAGVTYYIMIDGYSDDVGEFCISIPACSPALALHVSNITGSGAAVSWSGTGTFILEYGPPGFTPGTDANAGAGGTIINPAVSPQTITGLSIATAYDVYIRQNCSAASHGFSSNSMLATFTTLGAPPVNDDCNGAIDLIVFEGLCGDTTVRTTLNATTSATTPLPACGNDQLGYDDDVWFKFTALPGQTFANIDFVSKGGDADMAAQIYTSSDNTCSGTFTRFACSDDGGPGSMPGFTSLSVTPGTTYFIRVFSYNTGVNSQFTICVTKSLLINDNASGAITINVDAGCTGAIYTNTGATQTVGEPFGACSSLKGYATVWYKFTAPSGGAVKISTATGSGNTLTDTRLALFQSTDVYDYGAFTILACDEDGGSGAFGAMSVLYYTGLTAGTVYYIQVDKFDSAANTGTFCLTVDRLRDSMLSTTNNCNSVYQAPVGSNPAYTGWVPLMDNNSKLIALVRNTAGGRPDAYTVSQNISSGSIRQDITSGEYYLNRSYTINNTLSGTAQVNVQFFFLTSELTALTAVDAAATLSRLRVTRQTAAACQPDFVTANGTNSELAQTSNSNGSSNGVSWIRVNTNGFSNFYIHAVKSYLTGKVFLQGAYNSSIGRHKDVTPAWASVLNTWAKNQPYNNYSAGVAYSDTAKEGFGAGAQGGSGMQIVHVTNLNATGPGSLYAALGSNRTVVFDVGGTIDNFQWQASGNNMVNNLTIDGSTAPSPGITLDNNSLGDCLSFQDGCHDVIVKNIRVRNAGNDGINVINGYNFVFDHLSISGSGDGDLDITTEGASSCHNITVQWCIFGGGKPTWSGAMLVAYPGTKDISIHHNFYSTKTPGGVGERNPFVHNAINYSPNIISYLMADFTNNLVWNWGNSATGGFGYGSQADYGGTLQCRNNFYQSSSLPANAILVNHDSTGAKLYASGNVSGNTGINPNSVSNVATAWDVAPVTMQDPCTAASMVLAQSGVRPLDATDQILVDAVSLSTCTVNNAANYFGYTGNESVANGFFTSTPAATDIVDWVLLEIKNNSGALQARRAAFVREDGQIVDLDGVSPVSLYGLANGNYYITIRHRNHLGISTQNLLSFSARSLGVAPITSTFDFTTATDANIFGDAAAYKIINGINVMISGNANANNNVRYGGSNNDPGSILVFLGGVPTGVMNNVYSPNDVNLDGTIKYGGSNNDTGFLLNNALGGLPTQLILEQKR